MLLFLRTLGLNWRKMLILGKSYQTTVYPSIMSHPIQVSDIVNTSTIFSCTVDACGRQFLSHRGLAQHIRQKHRSMNIPATPSDVDTQLDSQSLGNSLQTGHASSTSSLFVCPTCGKECKSKSGLTRHSRLHTVPSDKTKASSSSTFICGSCGKVCKNQSGLTRHSQKCTLET